MRHYFLIFLLLMAVNVMAQGRYCKNYNDFVLGQWENLPSIRMIDHSLSHQLWQGGGDNKITSDDKAMAKILKKEALVVEYHDTLYVNLRKLRYKSYKLGRGYTRAVRLGEDKIAFAAKRRHVNVGYFFFGIVGAAISEYSSMKDKVCYILDNNGNGKKYHVKMLDDSAYKDALLESEQ